MKNAAGKGFVTIPNCEVTHTFQTHQTLRNAVHLLRENEMIGEWDVVPGIVRVPGDSDISLQLFFFFLPLFSYFPLILNLFIFLTKDTQEKKTSRHTFQSQN